MSAHLFGLKQKTPDERDFDLGKQLVAAGIDPAVSTAEHPFGHGLTYTDWRMNGNGPVQPGEHLPASWKAAREGAGDCVYAAWVNELKIALVDAGMSPAEADALVGNAETALRAYSEGKGKYNPVTGANDEGAEVRDRLKQAQKIGLKVAKGPAHKIGIYAAVDYSQLDHLLFALKYFEAVPIGCAVLPENEEALNTAEQDGKPNEAVWDDADSEALGLHCIPLVGRPDSAHIAALTWRRRIRLTDAYRGKRVEEAWCYLTPDRISKVTDKSYEGASEAVLAEYIKKAVALG
jgi:hypothetical protein